MRAAIELSGAGSEYQVTIRVGQPGGESKWSGRGVTLGAAIGSVEAGVRYLANWRGSRYRGVGRKPRGYWKACEAVAILESLRATTGATA